MGYAKWVFLVFTLALLSPAVDALGLSATTHESRMKAVVTHACGLLGGITWIWRVAERFATYSKLDGYLAGTGAVAGLRFTGTIGDGRLDQPNHNLYNTGMEGASCRPR